MSQKKLGFGLMRLPSLDPNDASKIDIEQTKKMVDTFIEKGFTYFDTAWMYCGFASENAAKEALVSRYPVIGKNRVNNTGEELYGMLYYADIYSFEENLHSEMEKIVLFNELPNLWTYPEIQPKLIEYYINLGNK